LIEVASETGIPLLANLAQKYNQIPGVNEVASILLGKNGDFLLKVKKFFLIDSVAVSDDGQKQGQ